MNWHKQYIFPALIAALGILASIVAFTQVKNFDETERQNAFLHQADSHFSVVEEQIFATQDMLTSLRAFVENNDSLKRSQFEQFSKALLQRHQDIQALEWIPKIPNDQLQEYEKRARNEGIENFRVKQKTDGELKPVSKRSAYFPVYYVHPFEKNKAAVGFDLGSNPARLKALESARDTGEIVMTRKITLVQETASQAGVLMFLAMYEGGSTPDSVKERQAKLTGFVLVVLRVGDLVVQSRENLRADIELVVSDVETQELLHDEHIGDAPPAKFVRQHERSIGLRKWLFTLTPKPNSSFQSPSQFKWLVLFGNLVITGVISLYFLSILRSRQLVRDEVEHRTRELASSEERFALAAEGSSVGIWDWIDVDREREYWSPQFYALLGYEPHEIDSTVNNFRALIHPEDSERTKEMLAAHLSNGDNFEIEFRLKTKSGKYKWFLGTAKAAQSATNKMTRMVGSIQDIHGRKTAELYIEAYAEDLKRSNADLEQFAYVASHDLKAPLRGIHNLAVWIEENIKETMDEETGSYISLLKGRIKRLESLLGSLLEYSRAGQNKENLVSTDMNSLIADISDLLSSSDRGFELSYDLPKADVPSNMMNQVLQNLINNAIKHHNNDKGKITIEHSSTDKEHIYSVADDGPGIPEEMHDKVFEMFQTLKPRDEVEGSGMGLAIVKKMINCHGGKIWIEPTKEDSGTIVKFSVPYEQQANVEHWS